MNRVFTVFFFLLTSLGIYAQNKELSYFDIDGPFERADVSAYPNLPANIKRLIKYPSGKVFFFKSNSPAIHAKWCVTIGKSTTTLLDIAASGLDLYIKNKDNQWQYASSIKPKEKCSESVIIQSLGKGVKEFMIYAPLYDELKSLQIGVVPNSSFEKQANPFKKNIIVYGSSITQGISASRAGMTYPAILTRETGYNFINYGFNGSAKLEAEVAEMLADLDADMYILDCVPNASPAEIEGRTNHLVKTLRKKKPNVPILFVESVFREYAHFNLGSGTWIRRQNDSFKAEYNKLVSEGVKGLHYIESTGFLGDDHDGTSDGTHPNDLGFRRYADAIKPKLLTIFKHINF